MTDRELIGRRMREHYEAVWRGGDAWELEGSAFEQARYAHQIALLSDRHYARALELGCGSGCLTRRLAEIADRVVALDIAPSAIERARAQTAGAGPGAVELRVANIMEVDFQSLCEKEDRTPKTQESCPLSRTGSQARGPWDLVVLSETIYCLGWLYPFFDVAWCAVQIRDAMAPGGRLLLANTYGPAGRSGLLSPWLIDTYRDLFRNVGLRLEREELFRGTKKGVDFAVLVSLFRKDGQL